MVERTLSPSRFKTSKSIKIPNTKQALELSVDAFNFMNLLNKEWGK
jgi:hypothetical protein